MTKKISHQHAITLLRELIKDKHGLIFISLILSIIVTVASIAVPFMAGKAIDIITSDGFGQILVQMSITAGLITISGAVSAYLSSYLNNVIAQRSSEQLRKMLIEKIQKIPFNSLDKISRGDLVSRMTNDIELVGDGLLQLLDELFYGVCTVIATMSFMLYINVYVALAIILLTPISILTTSKITKKTQKFFRKQQKDLGLLSGLSDEMISHQKLILAYNYQSTSMDRFEAINNEYRSSSMRSNFYSSINNPITRFINNIAYLAAGILGVVLKLSAGSIGSFLVYALRFARPFNEIGNLMPELQRASASASRIVEILSMNSIEETASQEIVTESVKGVIEFRDVSFSYDPSRPLIQNFNLSVKPGQRIAIVGKTGSGKTTLVNLLMRFYDINSGQILIDGYDISNITIDSLRNCFGMVLQDSWTFDATISENIAYSKKEASEHEIISASKAAYCHEFVMVTENMYDTILNESGGSLSDGQKQLICIARVMLKDAPILILDEATSNIDTHTEKLVQETFDLMTVGKTGFIIAHRLSTIRNADLILVLENGEIVEQGTHDQLLLNKGQYFDLYNSQFSVLERLK
ncbi:MAG: ABC transporter ATP-binding protein/permease [Christensenellaceae bacterium]|jgi:ATP-binding cassette subfamily B protein|nr:ABC transporter ATP-binding protein/permease [Christensenellaceae bacterium]